MGGVEYQPDDGGWKTLTALVLKQASTFSPERNDRD